MALGTSPAAVMRLVLARVAVLVGGGIVVGTIASIWATGFIGSLLFDVSPHDPRVLGGSVVVLVVIGAVAGWLPARRAARIDPAQVLREG